MRAQHSNPKLKQNWIFFTVVQPYPIEQLSTAILRVIYKHYEKDVTVYGAM